MKGEIVLGVLLLLPLILGICVYLDLRSDKRLQAKIDKEDKEWLETEKANPRYCVQVKTKINGFHFPAI